MKKYLEILKKCVLFLEIEEENLIPLLKCLNARVEKYKRREIIISEGDSAKFIGVVLSGSAQIEQVDYYGNRIIAGVVHGGEVFGESFACAGVKEIPVTVTAETDAEIMFIDSEKIINTCSNSCEFHRQIINNLLKVMAAKNIAFYQKIEITSKRFTREKLMTYLSIQAKKHASNKFYIPYDRQALADYLQVDRSGLSAEISKLQREGILKSNKNYFEILGFFTNDG